MRLGAWLRSGQGIGYGSRLTLYQTLSIERPSSLIFLACVSVCVVIPFILEVGFVGVSAGVTQEEGRTGFLHLPPAVLALLFLPRGLQPFLSLGDRGVDFFCVLTN